MIFASRVFIKTLYNAFPIVGVNGKVKLIPIFGIKQIRICRIGKFQFSEQ